MFIFLIHIGSGDDRTPGVQSSIQCSNMFLINHFDTPVAPNATEAPVAPDSPVTSDSSNLGTSETLTTNEKTAFRVLFP